MLPNPMNPIFMRFLPDRSLKAKIVRARRKGPRDLRLAHVLEARWTPARRVILVDDHRAHAFEEIVAVHAVLAEPVLHDHHLLEIEPRPLAELTEAELERGRRLPGHDLERLGRPGRALRLERGENRLDGLLAEAAVDRGALGGERRRPRG